MKRLDFIYLREFIFIFIFVSDVICILLLNIWGGEVFIKKDVVICWKV